ncbi:hypothetical protein DCAR_0101924 [Daucus carota subsp. sativus]|uniref:Uncharacterized protein n=1 Tax=Daucus carota subsp. sativus TaxID=79200 RepID=A0AAF1AJQ9_DAUCS|nr:hypothetical protein DCAR_0101924 [Daucus carota subsp. sativus]
MGRRSSVKRYFSLLSSSVLRLHDRGVKLIFLHDPYIYVKSTIFIIRWT